MKKQMSSVLKMGFSSLAVLSSLAIGLASAPEALASTLKSSPYQYESTEISLQSSVLSSPKHIVAVDPLSGKETSFIPIYYAEQVLSQAGISSSWNGEKSVLSVDTNSYLPSLMNRNYLSANSMTNRMIISIDGNDMYLAPKIVAIDPYSGQSTTYIPIYYLQVTLNALNIKSSWNGTLFRIDATPGGLPLYVKNDSNTSTFLHGPSLKIAGTNVTLKVGDKSSEWLISLNDYAKQLQKGVQGTNAYTSDYDAYVGKNGAIDYFWIAIAYTKGPNTTGADDMAFFGVNNTLVTTNETWYLNDFLPYIGVPKSMIPDIFKGVVIN